MRSSLTLLLLLFSMAIPLGAVLGVSLLPSAYAAPDPDLYAKTYGGTNHDYATSVVVASDGDIIVAGYTYSFGAGGSDSWVLRLNPDGSIEWQNTYGGTDDDEAYSVVEASDGDIIVAGSTGSFGAMGVDFWVLRLNPGGSIPDCDPMASTSVTPQSTSVSPDDTSVDPDATEVDPGVTRVSPSPSNAQEATQCYFASGRRASGRRDGNRSVVPSRSSMADPDLTARPRDGCSRVHSEEIK